MSIIEIKNLSFSYGKQVVLENVNLTVKENDFLAIIGPNGGGKSTLLKLILGINSVKNGSIHTFGELPKKNLAKVGYVPQNTNVNTDFPIKVIEVVLMGHIGTKRPLFGYAKEEKLCALGALAQVGMEKFANEKIGSLSGGQRQRVMIARALCANPKILILDEPTASIDVEGQKKIYELLETLNSFITIIVVSHDISIIMQYADKVVHINKTLSYHDVSKLKPTTDDPIQHFCEVELFNKLNENNIGKK
ncbi:MAG: Zinc ABC transporter, ATP-binding protein ZnuC [uncultured Sulfurovum sp.]|uniref:Zinc ABC transporter, ATP-binding protein ZnuC n=1 Tax=uncultured Sulfurovum sp. TaxID=269237 RepID=A0A6S6T0X7_9BACT|nr:MAG: Zinc ABC transporter, ATP-binding protein ZnuC [uncultured Sulfurovum sp.]